MRGKVLLRLPAFDYNTQAQKTNVLFRNTRSAKFLFQILIGFLHISR